MQKIDAHIHPKCYLERWKISSALSQGEKKMVYVFPYNKFELIKEVSINNEFFKKTNYYATLSDNGELDNNLERTLSGIYESTLQKLLDECLIKFEGGIFGEKKQIEIPEEILEKIYIFLAYTFFRSTCGEVYGLTIDSILHQRNISELENVKLGKFHFNMSDNTVELPESFSISKLSYNKNYIGNREMIKLVQGMFRQMNLTFLYAAGDLNYLTNNEVFTLFEFSETIQKSTFLIPIDPKLCILLGGEKDESNLKAFQNGDEEVKKVNWAILWNQAVKKCHPFVVGNQMHEIQRLITEYNLILTE